MKKIVTLAFCTLTTVVSIAQNITQRTCGTLQHHEYLKQTRPNYENERVQYEQQIKQYIANRSNPLNKAAVVTVTVPVVVHVLYANATQSISPSMAAAQAQVLNDDFAKLNADASNVPASFASVAAGANIRFCLAQRTPSNTATTGIVYKSTSVTSFVADDKVKQSSQGGDDAWDVTKYINIWICNLGGGLLGYGEFPTTSLSNTYGLVVHYGSVPGGSMANYNLGRTGTHEFGHVFNLFHTWGDDGGACTGSDLCSDTPNQTDAQYGCFTVGQVVTDACSPSAPGTQWMNYMNYVNDACMYMFTAQQATRMEAVVNTAPWNVLASSNGCTPISTASTSPLDASIASVLTPTNGGLYCDINVTPKVVLSNLGSTTLTSAKVLYKMDATTTQTLNWTGSLATNATATLTLNVYNGLTSGAHTFSVWVNAPNGGTDAVASNDNKLATFTITPTIPLPYSQDFEGTQFPPAGWLMSGANIINPASTWTRVANSTGIPVSPLSTACARMDNFSSATNISGQLNYLYLPAMDFSSAGANTRLYFDVAHKQFDYTTFDSLLVIVSSDCFQTVYAVSKKGDGASSATTSNSLATVSGTGTAAYVPTANNQWRRDSVSLASFAGNSKVYIIIASKSGWGNYVYLDNINIKNNIVATAPPTASIASAPSGCSGTSITFTSQTTNYPTSWTWSIPGASPASSTSQNPTVTYPTAGTYTVTLVVTNSIGSSAPTTKVITIGSSPFITSTSTLYCGGSAVTLSASGPVTTYSWSNGATGSSITVNPTSTTTYTVYGSNGPGCFGTSVSTVSVNPTPTLIATSATICAGATATLNVSGANTYTWSTGANGSSISDSPTTTTPYTVGGTSSAGCSGYITSYIVIATAPVMSITNATICVGGNAIISANGVSSYTWSNGSNANSIATSPTVTTTYTVSGSLSGCSSNALQTATVKVNNLPNVTLANIPPICVTNAPVSLGGSPVSGTYTGTGITGTMFNPATAGIGTFPINYYYTDLNGCSNSASKTLTVSACTGLVELTNSAITLYPNPANEVLYINFNNTATNNTVIELYDAIGKLVITQKVTNSIETLALTDLAKGIYSIRIVTDKTQLLSRIIKE